MTATAITMRSTNTVALRCRLLGVLMSAGPLAVACGGAVESGSPSGSTPSSTTTPVDPNEPNRSEDTSSPPPPTTSSDARLKRSMCSAGGGPCGGAREVPADVACLTREEMEKIFARDGANRKATPPFDADGCLAPQHLRAHSTCYGSPNALAVAGPVKEGDACCYAFCAGCCSGRPLIVNGEARVASTCARADWLRSDRPAIGLERFSEATRRAVGAAWLDDACMEHASVASFARFSLQLLAVGAPPELLRETQEAMADEIAHARLCFTIASRLLEREVGPTPLSLAGMTIETSLAKIAAETVREGCIGETLASLQAAAQRDLARDEETWSALATISEDEARHAELAWRFVRWALASGGADVRLAITQAFEDALDALPVPHAPPADVDLEAWNALGRLDRESAEAVTRAARDEVLRPCIHALLGRDASSSSRLRVAPLVGAFRA